MEADIMGEENFQFYCYYIDISLKRYARFVRSFNSIVITLTSLCNAAQTALRELSILLLLHSSQA